MALDNLQIFVAGLAAGWAIGMILDYLFWRRKRRCKDSEIKLREKFLELRAENKTLNVQVAKNSGNVEQIDQLRHLLDEQEVTLKSTMTELEAYKSGSSDVEQELAELRRLDNRTGILETRIQERDVEISQLRQKLSNAKDLEAQLKQRDDALLKLRDHVNRANELETTLSERDKQINKLQVALAGAGAGALAVSATGGDDEGQLERLAELELALDERDAQIARLIKEQAELEETLHAGIFDGGEDDETMLSARIAELELMVQERDDSLLAIRDRVASHVHELEGKIEEQAEEIERLRATKATMPAPTSRRKYSTKLTEIYGIGPKIAQLWRDKGIETFADLANVTVQQVEEIQDESGRKFGIEAWEQHQSWVEQAHLANLGDWVGFEAYQDKLREQRKS